MRETFDLPAYLLKNVYAHMDSGDSWTPEEAEKVAADIHQCDGISLDPEEVYQIIAEFRAQDTEEG